MLHLDEVIGSGAFGTVYRGRMHSADGLVRRVAIKLLSPDLSAERRAVRRLKDEARLLALVDHPGLVPVYALEQIDDRWAVVMGYVDGFQLYDALNQAGPLPPAAVRDIGVQVAECLDALWQSRHPETRDPLRVVHRDIKPHNLMVDANGTVRLLDLGVASARFESRETRTLAGELAGTLAYMSPQRLMRQNDEHAGDIYSLGATLYQLCTGELLPDSGVHEDGHADMLAELGEGPLIDCIRTALAYEPEARPTAYGLAKALRALELPGDDLHTWSAAVVQRHGPRAGAPGPASGASDHLGRHTGSPEATLILDVDGAPITSEVPGTLDVEALTEPPPRSRAAGLALALAVLSLLAGLTLWWVQQPSGPPIVVLLAPAADPATLLAEQELLRQHVERRTGRPVRLEVGESYEAVSDKLINGQVAFAQLPHGAGTHTVKREPRVRRLATKIVDGSATVDGYIIVRRTDTAKVAADLLGSRICYSDALSNTGYRLPRAWLSENGIDPENDVREHLSGNHEQVLRDVVEGTCRAGGTFSHNFTTGDQRGIPVAQLRILALTGQIPHDAWYAGPAADPATAEALATALLELDPQRDFGRPHIGESERITGFTRDLP